MILKKIAPPAWQLAIGSAMMRADAPVVKLVYTPDLGSGAARRGGSSPLWRTIFKA